MHRSIALRNFRTNTLIVLKPKPRRAANNPRYFFQHLSILSSLCIGKLQCLLMIKLVIILHSVTYCHSRGCTQVTTASILKLVENMKSILLVKNHTISVYLITYLLFGSHSLSVLIGLFTSCWAHIQF